MSAPQPEVQRPDGRLARSWSLAWRLGIAVLVGVGAFALQYGPAVDRVGTGDAGELGLAVLMGADVLAAPFALGLLVWRRRAAAAAAIVLVSAFSTLSVGAGILAIVGFAASQPARRIVALGVAFTALASVTPLLLPDPAFPWWAEVLGVAVLYGLLVLIGRYVRSRRQLLASLQAQARSTRREQEALRESARSAERSRIAREMHDALGHRLSVIAMHAGALESRPDLSADDTRTAAGVVRESAHSAMSELRQVLGVLDEGTSVRTDGPDVPTLAQLDDLVAAGIGGGVVPALRCEADLAAIPEPASRQLYRIAQEALTNVRKHAPGQPTTVVVRLQEPDAVELVVRNRSGASSTPVDADGLHHGLAGLGERARLAGGTVSARTEGDEFVVRAVLPCRR